MINPTNPTKYKKITNTLFILFEEAGTSSDFSDIWKLWNALFVDFKEDFGDPYNGILALLLFASISRPKHIKNFYDFWFKFNRTYQILPLKSPKKN